MTDSNIAINVSTCFNGMTVEERKSFAYRIVHYVHCKTNYRILYGMNFDFHCTDGFTLSRKKVSKELAEKLIHDYNYIYHCSIVFGTDSEGNVILRFENDVPSWNVYELAALRLAIEELFKIEEYSSDEDE